MAESGPSVRAFLALDPGPEVRLYVARLGESLREIGLAAALVDPALAHLTIHFLGQVPESQLPLVSATCTTVCARLPSFDLGLGGLGGFPRLAAPRALWIGLTAGQEPLGTLHQALRPGLVSAGLALEERPFSPHLTVARVRRLPSAEQAASLRGLARAQDGVTFRLHAASVELMRSALSRAGPRYSLLASFPLALTPA